MVKLVKANLTALQRIPAVFVSVSMAQKTIDDGIAPPAKIAAAEAGLRSAMDRFVAKTGWSPPLILSLAGALAFTKYGFITRLLMKRISKKEGGPVDTTRDYEFTDWPKLDRFVQDFLRNPAMPERLQSELPT
jgi:menaquinone-dependent protoporphyrinogen oxidase